ncbi:hypothetical protein DAPPUDRAFT_325259 [Daphnia pulex]|uniref:Uncharacterized protein n=1 Tax=Daphnia pulex TaxID=6669 RepID=E9H471_DAPPU|nr:hypothetical protein DAPPUDRAFT_325259 [Daphnia pulex]|eukprot:EFX73488.1 hypothetical protein DAPPUDRAFT_325259 [Daphnia pulex]
MAPFNFNIMESMHVLPMLNHKPFSMSSQYVTPDCASCQSANSTDEEIEEAVIQEQVIYIIPHEEDPIVVEQGTPTKRRCMHNVHKKTATAISAAKPTFIIHTSKPFYTRFTGPLKQSNFLYHLERPVSHSKTEIKITWASTQCLNLQVKENNSEEKE